MLSVIEWGPTRATGALTAGLLCFLATPAPAEQLQFVVRAGATAPTEDHSYQPRAAPSGGLAALLQLGDHFAAGAMLDTLWLSWHSPPGGDGRFDGPLEFPEDGTRSMLFAVSGRFYPLRDTSLVPYLEGSGGYVSVSMPGNLHCDYGSGASGQLALGLDWQVTSGLRLGVIAGARPLRSARACYPEGRENPPDIALGLLGQLAFTTFWSAR